MSVLTTSVSIALCFDLDTARMVTHTVSILNYILKYLILENPVGTRFLEKDF